METERRRLGRYYAKFECENNLKRFRSKALVVFGTVVFAPLVILFPLVFAAPILVFTPFLSPSIGYQMCTLENRAFRKSSQLKKPSEGQELNAVARYAG